MRNTAIVFIIMAILLATWGMAFAHGDKHKAKNMKTGISYTRDILPIFTKNSSDPTSLINFSACPFGM